MKRWLSIVGLLGLALTISAQQMRVERFAKQKKGPFNMKHVKTDKQLATIDMMTGEKGFKFLANGKTEVQAEEAEGVLTLKTPDKTSFLVINHPDYGQCSWKVPGKKGLRKKQHYEAYLLTFSPTKSYKLQKQWVIFEIQPKDAIVTVDSMTTTVRTGICQFNLPVGTHPYRVEAPFHEEVVDSFELSDTARLILPISLQPFYSYLTVKTPLENARILVDGQWIGNHQATSGHLLEGSHRLTVMVDDLCYYESTVSVSRAEKKNVELTAADLSPRISKRQGSVPVVARRVKEVTDSTIASDSMKTADSVSVAAIATTAPVTIVAPDDSTAIWVNRELMGYGTWEGQLPLGYYQVSTEKEGLESRTTGIWVDDGSPKKLELLPPMADYGLLNIHSDEIGAKVYVNGALKGVTPLVVENLPAGTNCRIKLTKKGFRDSETEVLVVGNDMVDVNIKMKKI